MKTYSLIDVNPEQGDVTFETGLSYRMAKESISHYEDRYGVTPEIVVEQGIERVTKDELLEALKALLPYAENEAAGLADIDEPELADMAWGVIDIAKSAIQKATTK